MAATGFDEKGSKLSESQTIEKSYFVLSVGLIVERNM